MTFALKYPNLLEKLVVVDMAPVKYSSIKHSDVAVPALRDMPLSEMKSR